MPLTPGPFSGFKRNGSRLLCADGKVRAAEVAFSADTFFSVPARVRVNGRWVRGYATTVSDYDFPNKTGYAAYAFMPYTANRPECIPDWPAHYSPESLELIRASGAVDNS